MENTMTMTTNDIRILALLLDIEPKFLSAPDAGLLVMVYEELGHRAQLGEGRFKSFYDSLPNDIAIKFMVDRRTLEWMLENKCHFITDTNKPTLAERLERGARTDIWADTSHDDSDDGIYDAVEDAQFAMVEAAELLRKHGLDK
jgi:hypothetical protein